MTIFEVIGNISGALVPHIHYGNYGGYWNRRSKDIADFKKPIDKLDVANLRHDILKNNAMFLEELWSVNVSEMRYKLLGQIYRLQCTIAFWPLIKLGI